MIPQAPNTEVCDETWLFFEVLNECVSQFERDFFIIFGILYETHNLM
jgi:hypothetical protein